MSNSPKNQSVALSLVQQEGILNKVKVFIPVLLLSLSPFYLYQNGSLDIIMITWSAVLALYMGVMIRPAFGRLCALAILLEVSVYHYLSSYGFLLLSTTTNVSEQLFVLCNAYALLFFVYLLIKMLEKQQILDQKVNAEKQRKEIEQQRLIQSLRQEKEELKQQQKASQCKQAQNQPFSKAEEKNSMLVQFMHDAVVMINAKGCISSCNPAAEELFKHHSQEMHGLNINQFLPDFLSPNLLQSQKSSSNQTAGPFQARVKDSIGEELQAEVWLASLKLSEEFQFALYIRNLTEEQRLAELQDNFVSVVSHELRTPMTSILGSLRLLQSGITGELEPQSLVMVDMAIRNSERLTRLLNDLLDIQKLETEKLSMNLHLFRLDLFLEETIYENQGTLQKYNASIQQEELSDVYVIGDQDRLKQVFSNLLSNALKHTPEDQSVKLFTKVDQDGYVRVHIEDQGPGIPDEFKKRIFKKFQQADNSSVRINEGTGLGLAISKAIIEQHNGKIGFYNKESSGSVFWFELEHIEEEQAKLITASLILPGIQ